jgi:hypothetical protein
MRSGESKRERGVQLCGWILFVVCALFFIANSVKGKDVLGFIGSFVFLIACFVFLVPFLSKRNDKDEKSHEIGDKTIDSS